MAVTGWKSPSAYAFFSGDVPWDNPSNAYSDDGSYTRAEWDVVNGWNSAFGEWYDFGFTTADIPSGSTIDGIEWRIIDAKASSTNSQRRTTLRTRVKIDPSNDGTLESTGNLSTSDSDYTFGGATYLDGLTTPSDSDIRSINFLVQVQAQYARTVHDATDGDWGEFDHVEVRVYYTESGTDVPLDAGSFSLTGLTATVTPPAVAASLHLGRWTGTTGGGDPTSTFTSPSNMLATEVRNDNSAYTFTYSNSRLTLPSTGLADGYLIKFSYEYQISHNNRDAHAGEIQQISGTGNFVGSPTSGYARNSANDLVRVSCWAFIDSPSASAEFAMRWKREVGDGTPAGTPTRSCVEVYSLWYDNIGMYTSTTTGSASSATTLSQLGSLTVAHESDTNAIELSGINVTAKSDNKKWLALGAIYYQGLGGRTQRLVGFKEDGSDREDTIEYFYSRDTGTDYAGSMFTGLFETATANKTITPGVMRGPTVGTFPNSGATSGGSTASLGDHSYVLIELPADAEVIHSRVNTASGQAITSTSPVDIDVVTTVDFNDSASFTKVDAEDVNAEVAMDALVYGSIYGGYGSSSSTRYEGQTRLTVNGTEQATSAHGNYGRGDQGSADTWGYGSHAWGYLELSANDDFGLSANSTGNTGPVETIDGQLWAINLDTIVPASAGDTPVPLNPGSFVLNGLSSTITTSDQIDLNAGSYSLTGYDATVSSSVPVDLDAGTFSWSGLDLGIAFAVQLQLDAGSFVWSGLDLDIQTGTTVDLNAGSFTLTGFDISVTSGISVDLDLGGFTWTGFDLTVTTDDAINLDAGSFTLTGFDVAIGTTVGVALDSGLFALTGLTANVAIDDQINLDAGSFSLTGLDALVSSAGAIDLDAGSFTWTGQDLTLTTDETISLDAGSYTWAGFDALVTVGATVTLDAGAFSLTGYDLTVTTDESVNLDAGGFTWTGYNASVEVTVPVDLDLGAYLLTGFDAALQFDRSVDLDVGAFVWAGNDITIAAGSVLALDAGAFVLTGLTANIATDDVISLDDGAFVWSGQELSITTALNYVLDAGSFDFNGFDADVTTAEVLALEAGSYVLTGFDASLVVDTAVDLDVGSFDLTGLPATIASGEVVQLDTGAFALNGLDLTVGADVGLDLDAGDFTLTGLDVDINVTPFTDAEERPPGGWLPVKYVDAQGREVDLRKKREELVEAVEDIVEEVQAEEPRRATDLRTATTNVLAALQRGAKPADRALARLRRELAEQEAALLALQALIEAKQREDDDLALIMLLAS